MHSFFFRQPKSFTNCKTLPNTCVYSQAYVLTRFLVAYAIPHIVNTHQNHRLLLKKEMMFLTHRLSNVLSTRLGSLCLYNILYLLKHFKIFVFNTS